MWVVMIAHTCRKKPNPHEASHGPALVPNKSAHEPVWRQPHAHSHLTCTKIQFYGILDDCSTADKSHIFFLLLPPLPLLSPSTPYTKNMRDYTDLSLPELDKLLRERSLATEGLKDSLVSRLEAYDAVNDPSPSPELHLSPTRCPEQKHQTQPNSLHHLPTDPDEDFVDWDADDEVIPRVGIVAEFGTAMKAAAGAAGAAGAADAADAAGATGATGTAGTTDEAAVISSPRSKCNSIADDDDEYYSSQLSNISPTPIEKISKSGFKYNSIAETFFPDDSSPTAVSSLTSPAITSPNSPPKLCKVPPNTPSRTSSNVSALSTRIPNSPSSTPATPLATPSRSRSNTLSKVLGPSISNGSAITTPVKPTHRTKAIDSTQTGSPFKAAVPVQTNSATTVTAAPNATPTVDAPPGSSSSTAAACITETSSDKNIAPKSTIGSSRLRTTQSGFQFNSISALFPGAVSKPPAPYKPQPITNAIVNTASTDAILTPKEEEARRLIVRAARFGTTAGREDPTAVMGRKHGRSGLSEADYNVARERERRLEIEKEREREIIRQRVTGSAKRQRNDGDDDRRPENQYKRHRHTQYRSSGSSSRTHHSGRHRY